MLWSLMDSSGSFDKLVRVSVALAWFSALADARGAFTRPAGIYNPVTRNLNPIDPFYFSGHV